MKKKIILLILCLGIAIALHGQTNFTGSWKLKQILQVAGPEYSNAMAEALVIKQTADSVWTGKRGLAMNGTKLVFFGDENRKMVKSFSWAADKKSFKVTTVIYMPGNDKEIDLTREDTYSMVGVELVLQRKSIESNSESWETKGIYTKE
ncbi:hypothetical protein [Pedobacter africanus]|uniref:Lipocalin-like domain-containing protein n=1 Tax=Pedobacter africanus TaxID=151894 RepID=A0A1W1Z6Z8_9SPHI|nr:hypothetical protein [Pedobacter africanus]SMC44082.1 hypothetical protein SAMN04488524_0422 [Pedobacter africanus]